MPGAKILNSARSLVFDVCLVDTVIIEKNQECLVSCYVKIADDRPVSDLLFLPYHDKMSKIGVFAASAIVRNHNNTIPVRIMNAEEHDVTIYKNTKIGFVEYLENAMVENNRMLYVPNSSQDNEGMKTVIYNIEQNKDLNEKERLELINLLKKYKSVFSKSKMDIGCCKAIKHQIILENPTPVNLPMRRVPMGFENKVDDIVNDLLEKDIIRTSDSPWNSPLVVVPKKNGDIRLCVDYRRLNSITRKTVFPIPETQHLLDSLQGSKFFSSIDLSSAYYQCELEEDDKEYTAFRTRRGHYEFNRMPFGLCGAPFTFQKMMNVLLRTENWEKCLIYLDDVLIFGRTFNEHLQRLTCVLDKICAGGIKLSPEKCSFFKKELVFLGHVISGDGIKTDPTKVSAIKEWKKPVNIEDLRKFLGFTNYYRKFVKSYASLTAPLENMMKNSCLGNINMQKKTFLKWNETAEASFEKLKMVLTTTPVLAYPSRSGKFILDCDASHNCMGAVLSQIQGDKECVIAYASKKMSKCQISYCITRKELLSVYTFVTQFKHYLLGRKFLIRTDHRALVWMMQWKKPNTSQYCSWIAELEIYDFDIEHRAGELHTNADFLSRLPQCEQCELPHNDPKRKRNVKNLEDSDTEQIRFVNVSKKPSKSEIETILK